MPELPEVDQVQALLESDLLSKEIVKTRIYNHWEKIPRDFRELLYHKKCQKIYRHGKCLFLVFDDKTLMVYFSTSGSFQVRKKDSHHYENEHFSFETYNKKIFYRDKDCLGNIQFINSDTIKTLLDPERIDLPQLNLGIDALNKKLNPNNRISYRLWEKWFFNKFLPSSPIHYCLLQQHGIAGIDKIYASEILFSSRINPKTEIGSINSYQKFQIIRNSWKILRSSIKTGGLSFANYNGGFDNYLAVYKRKKCQICSRKIARILIESRHVFYCRNCQPKT